MTIMKLNYLILYILRRRYAFFVPLVLLLYVPLNSSKRVKGNTKEFVCNAAAFHKPSLKNYINCTLSLRYRGNMALRCNTAEGSGMLAVVINLEEHAVFEIRSYSLNCVSDAPMKVSSEFGTKNASVILKTAYPDVSKFPIIRQKRIIDKDNMTSYKHELHVPLLKFNLFLLSLPIAVLKYQILTTDPDVIEMKVFLAYNAVTHLPYIDGSKCPNHRQNFFANKSIGLNSLLIKEFVEIPVFSFKTLASNLYREICKYKVLNDENFEKCSGAEEYSPTICLPFEESSILRKEDKTIFYNGSLYNYGFQLATLLDFLKVKSHNLRILNPEEIKPLSTPTTNNTRTHLDVLNHYITYDKLEEILGLLKRNVNVSCDQSEPLAFDQLLYILQLLGVKEIVIWREGDLSFNNFGGFKIRSKLLLNYGPGKYYFGHQACFEHNNFIIDFSMDPKYSHIFPTQSKYDIFSGEIKSNNLTFSCARKTATISVNYFNWGSIAPYSSAVNLSIFHFNLSGVTHDYQSAAVIIHAFPPDAWRYNHMDLYCGERSEGRKWTIFHNDMVGPQLMYLPKPDLFSCTGRAVDMNHWMCTNRIQCQLIASLCMQQKLSTFKWENESVPSTVNDGYKHYCMNSLNLVSTRPCSDFRGDTWDQNDKTLRTHEQCKMSKPANMGVIQCFGEDYFLYDSNRLIYFRGFDNILYVDDKMKGPLPKNATLKLISVTNESVFYTKEEYTFQCKAHCFFYVDGIRWFLKFTNGTVLQPPQAQVKHLQESEWEVCNSQSELKLVFLDKSFKEVICSAPSFSNNDWTNISLEINIIESTLPKITSSSTDVRFIEGGIDQPITCAVEGLPQPTIKWTRPDSEMQASLLTLNNALVFPVYNSNFSGEYVCTASNVAGNASMTFVVDTVREKKDYTNTYTIITVVLSAAVLFAILSIIYLINERIKKYREMKEIISLLNGSNGKAGNGKDGAEADPTTFLFNTSYEIRKSTFIINRSFLLGKGEFGEVYKGLLEGVNGTVAFKTVRSGGGMGPLKALVSEAKILMYIGPHEHLVTLLGVYRREIKSGVLYVAIEFCEMGSLKSFLTENGRLFTEEEDADTEKSGYEDPFQQQHSLCTTKSLLMWSEQIASAMEYLGTKNVVHSDLATRNVLLTSEGTAKVTDFGLSRRMYSYSEYIKKGKDPLPWRWVAIESLRTNTFSVKSDVWAYGITLWEIFSLGDSPYPGMEYNLEFLHELENGLKNYKPKWASDEIYDMMVLCWHLNPEKRPNFSSMKRIFEHAVSNGMSSLRNMVSQEANLEDIGLQLATSVYVQLET